MTAADLIAIGRLLHGETWQRAFAADLGVSRELVQRWAYGRSPVAGKHTAKIKALLEARVVNIRAAVATLTDPAQPPNPAGPETIRVVVASLGDISATAETLAARIDA